MDANRDDEHNKQFYDEQRRFKNGSKLFSFLSAIGLARPTTITELQQCRRNCVKFKMSYDKPFRFAAFLIARYILSTIFLQHSINITFRFIGQTFYGCYCNWFDESYKCWAQRQVVALWHCRILSPAVCCSVLAYVWSVGIETHNVEKCVHKYMIMMYCANDIATSYTSEFRICRNNRNRKIIIICIIDGWMLFIFKPCPGKRQRQISEKIRKLDRAYFAKHKNSYVQSARVSGGGGRYTWHVYIEKLSVLCF